MKRLFTVVVLLALLVMVMPSVNAQGTATAIAYGETVTGTLTNEAFEVPYTFEGAAGDVIIVDMKPVDPFGELSSPSIVLLDSANALLGSLDSYGTEVFAAKLPADGSYTILATRVDGRTGTSVGDFTLTLLLPQVLTPGETVSGEVGSESAAYYVYESDAPFTITYEKSGGDFNPEVAVNVIGDDFDSNSLNAMATLSGDLMTSGSLTVTPSSSVAVTSYVITLKTAFFDFYFDPVVAQYSLTLSQ